MRPQPGRTWGPGAEEAGGSSLEAGDGPADTLMGDLRPPELGVPSCHSKPPGTCEFVFRGLENERVTMLCHHSYNFNRSRAQFSNRVNTGNRVSSEGRRVQASPALSSALDVC